MKVEMWWYWRFLRLGASRWWQRVVVVHGGVAATVDGRRWRDEEQRWCGSVDGDGGGTKVRDDQRVGEVVFWMMVMKLGDGEGGDGVTKVGMSDESLAIPLDEIQIDDKLNLIEEPVKIMDREVKRLKQSRIPILKVRWNSRRGPEFT
ncbi:hypothetical protein Tco_0947310 [Tanacetum coccineum]